MGENEQGGMLRTVIVVGLVALIAAVITMGVVGLKASMTKNTDRAVDVVAKNREQVVNRNLYLNSRVLTDRYGMNDGVKVTLEPFDSTTNMWHLVAPQGSGHNSGIYLWEHGKEKIPNNSDWSYSIDIKGTGVYSYIGIADSIRNSIKVPIGSEWSRISQTGHNNEAQHKDLVMYFDTRNAPLDVYIKLPKLEIGDKATDWTPAPED